MGGRQEPETSDEGATTASRNPEFLGSLIRLIAVIGAGVLAIGLGRLVDADSDQGDLRRFVVVVAATSGLIVVQQLVMQDRRLALMTSTITALASAVLVYLTDVGVEPALGTIVLAVLLTAGCVLIDDLPTGVLAFAPWSMLDEAGRMLGEGAEAVAPVGAAAIGLTGAVALVHRPDTVSAPSSPSATVGGTDRLPDETIEASVTAMHVDELTTSQLIDDDTAAAFEALRASDHPTMPVDDLRPDGPDVARSAPPQASPTSTADREPLVLGQPSRADGAAPALPVTPIPYTAGSESDHYVSGPWTIQAHSTRGSSHAHAGEPRQDAFALTTSRNGRYLVVAVSDGLGSAKHSNFGSYWATRLATSFLANDLDDDQSVADVLDRLPALVSTKLEELRGDIIGADANQIAATLVVCVVPTDRPAPVWLARVGDSDALVLTQSGAWASGFGGGDTSAIETGTTDVLPHHPGRVETRTIDGSKINALLIATDGVSRVVENSPELVGHAFAELLADPVDAAEFRRVVEFRRRGAHDDRTVVALWHRTRGGSA